VRRTTACRWKARSAETGPHGIRTDSPTPMLWSA
jgi:hypothetical protein